MTTRTTDDPGTILNALRTRRQSQATPAIEASMARRTPHLDKLRENLAGVEGVWTEHGEWVKTRAQSLGDAVWSSYPTLGHEHGAVRALDEAMVIERLITQAREALETYTRTTAPVGQAGLETHLANEEDALRRAAKNLWRENAEERITRARAHWKALADKAARAVPELLSPPAPEPSTSDKPKMAPRKSMLREYGPGGGEAA